MVRCSQLNDRSQCNMQRYACEWMNEQCEPISSTKALQMRRQEQNEAKGGWYKIMLILMVVILVLFMAIQQIFGINVFDSMSGNSNSTPGAFIIILVLLAVLWGFYHLLKKCDFSFSCFLLGGEAGLMEQPIEHMRSEKYKKDKLKQHFFEQGQPMTFNMPRDRREDEPRAEEGNRAASRGVPTPRDRAGNERFGNERDEPSSLSSFNSFNDEQWRDS